MEGCRPEEICFPIKSIDVVGKKNVLSKPGVWILKPAFVRVWQREVAILSHLGEEATVRRSST
jgi:hypothetical protein